MKATINEPKQMEPKELVEARRTACSTGFDGTACGDRKYQVAQTPATDVCTQPFTVRMVQNSDSTSRKKMRPRTLRAPSLPPLSTAHTIDIAHLKTETKSKRARQGQQGEADISFSQRSLISDYNAVQKTKNRKQSRPPRSESECATVH